MVDRNAVLGKQNKPLFDLGRDGMFFLTVLVIATIVFGAGAGAWVYAEADSAVLAGETKISAAE